jgi:hypothetical protein
MHRPCDEKASVKRRGGQREERRKDGLELNLLSEDSSAGSPGGKARRGCTLPFTGSLLLLVAAAAIRLSLG